MNQQKKNAEDAKALKLRLNEIVEIEQKIDYYKSILMAYDELSELIGKEIEEKSKSVNLNTNDKIQIARLRIEKISNDSNIYEKKKFFEHWLNRKNEYDKKFAFITDECNKNFDEINNKAKKIGEKNIKFKSFVDKFEKEENVTQKLKNEYYLMLKYEISRLEGKGVFLEI
jgi:hypothetical protein